MSVENKKNKKSKKRDEQKASQDTDGKIDELINDLQRLQAEFENYKKRSEKENQRFKEFSTADLVKTLLPVIDSFEMALKSPNDHEKFVSGVKMIFGQLIQILGEEGLSRMEVVGKKLDPHMHDVLLSEKSDNAEDTILEELQPGYLLKEAVLRHAKVKIRK